MRSHVFCFFKLNKAFKNNLNRKITLIVPLWFKILLLPLHEIKFVYQLTVWLKSSYGNKHNLKWAVNDRCLCGQQWWEWGLGQHWSWHQVTGEGHIFRFCATCPILYYATGRMISGNDPPVALHKLTSSVWYMFLLNWGQNPPLQWQQFQTNQKLITNKHFLLLGVKTNLRGHKTTLDFHVTCVCCTGVICLPVMSLKTC